MALKVELFRSSNEQDKERDHKVKGLGEPRVLGYSGIRVLGYEGTGV